MIYNKAEMRSMLIDFLDLSEDAIDIIVKILGDPPQTYIKILNAGSEYKTFLELEENNFNNEIMTDDLTHG